MKNDPGRRLTRGKGHIERGGDQAGPHVRGDSPANYLTRIKIDNGRELSPPVPCFYVRDVAAAPGVAAAGGEIPADHVRGGHRLVPADSGPLPGSRMTSAPASGPDPPGGAPLRPQVGPGRPARA